MNTKKILKTILMLVFLGLASIFGFSKVLGYGGSIMYLYNEDFNATNCTSITYGEWGACINGMQYRNIIGKSSQDCTLSSSQQTARSKVCTTDGNSDSDNVSDLTNDELIKQILGDKKYSEGTLVRGSNRRIYVIYNGKLQYIPNLEELNKYLGRPILNVDDSIISSFEKLAILGIKKYSDGTLLRVYHDNRVYVIINGRKVQIRTLEELKRYKGQQIINIQAEELNNY